MKTRIRVALILFAVNLLLIGCARKTNKISPPIEIDKTDEISHLIDTGKFNEAVCQIATLPKEDKLRPDVKLLLARANLGNLLIKAKALKSQKNYTKVISTLASNLNAYSTFPQLRDTLTQWLRQSAQEGAKHYLSTGEYENSYECLSTAEKFTVLSERALRMMNDARKHIICGTWTGTENKIKTEITLRLNALTPTTFTGVASIQGAMFTSPIKGGLFDGKEFSATFVYQSRAPIVRRGGIIPGGEVGSNPTSAEFSVSGRIEKGVMKLAIYEKQATTYWTLRKQTQTKK